MGCRITQERVHIRLLQGVVAFWVGFLFMPSPGQAASFQKLEQNGIEIRLESVPQTPQINRETIYSIVLRQDGRLFDPVGVHVMATKDSKNDQQEAPGGEMDHGQGHGAGRGLAPGGADVEMNHGAGNSMGHPPRGTPDAGGHGSAHGSSQSLGPGVLMADVVPTNEPGTYRAIIKYSEGGAWTVAVSLPSQDSGQRGARFSFSEHVGGIEKSVMGLNVVAGLFISAFLVLRGKRQLKVRP